MAVGTITKIDADLLKQVALLIVAAVGRNEAIGLVGPIDPADYEGYLDELLTIAERGDGGLVVAAEDGEVTGTAQWTRSPYKTRKVFGELDRVVVAPRHRRKGVARHLVEAVVQDARRNGIELLGLEVRGNNDNAIALYESCGFGRTGKWEQAVAVGPARYDVVLMARRIVTFDRGGYRGGTMRWVWLIVGILLVLMGAVWTLQGLDIMGGSAMSGVTLWAVVGPIVAVVGLVLVAIGLRKPRAGV